MKHAGKAVIVVALLSSSLACGGGGGGGGGPSASFALSSGASAEDAGLQSLDVVLHTAVPLIEALSVDVVDLGTGTATSGSDYTAIPTQTVTFPIGSADGATQTIPFEPLDDALVEAGNETVRLRLENALGGGVSGPSTFVGTIQNIHSATVGFANGELFETPSYEVEIVDRLGAGDAMASGIIHGLLDGDFAKGLQYGAAMGAIKHTLPGDLPWIEKEEVEATMTGQGLRIKR